MDKAKERLPAKRDLLHIGDDLWRESRGIPDILQTIVGPPHLNRVVELVMGSHNVFIFIIWVYETREGGGNDDACHELAKVGKFQVNTSSHRVISPQSIRKILCRHWAATKHKEIIEVSGAILFSHPHEASNVPRSVVDNTEYKHE